MLILLDTLEGPLYLATMKDIFQKEIVGWSLADHMRTELCTKALENAVMKHRPPKGLMHHSDRGSQFQLRGEGFAVGGFKPNGKAEHSLTVCAYRVFAFVGLVKMRKPRIE